MTPEQQTRRRLLASAHLELIRAELAKARAGRVLKACYKATSMTAAFRVLHGQDHRISTLVDIADALNCDVEIVIRQRSA